MTVLRARKKPVVIEAMRFDGTKDSARDIHDWSDGKAQGRATNHEWFIVIATLEGEMVGNAGDYILRGVKGEFYPCKSEIFDATYEVLPPPLEPFQEGHT